MDGNSKCHRSMYSTSAFILQSYFHLVRHDLRRPHREKYCKDTIRKHIENVRCSYNVQPARQQEGPEKEISRQDLPAGSARKLSTIAQQDIKGFLQKVSSFRVDF